MNLTPNSFTDMKEENKLIADNVLIDEFVTGRKLYNGNTIAHQRCTPGYENIYNCTAITKLKYHSDWNELIPVVEKCMGVKDMGSTHINYHVAITTGLLTVDINRVYNAVINFITWYNQQTK